MTRKVRVSDLIKIIHDFAPPALACEWDNVGFLLGDASCEVKKILLCLDITPDCVDKAVDSGTNLIISHHPLIFKPLKKITNSLYLKLIKNDIAVISAHTNLDITKGGVNHRLADIFGLQNLEILSRDSGNSLFQIAVYTPDSAVDDISQAVFSAGAGQIGNYSHCCNFFPVKAQFRPLAGSNPSIGELNKNTAVDEIKLEFFADSFNLNKVIRSIHKSHPYETPVIAVYPLKQNSPDYGLGLIGVLPEAVSISDFAHKVKNSLNSPTLKVWLADKSPDSMITRIAVCGGSGASLISDASNRADLFLSGEFGYHSMLDSPIPLIEAGHFHTEFPVLHVLKKLLSTLDLQIDILPPDQHETTTRTLYF